MAIWTKKSQEDEIVDAAASDNNPQPAPTVEVPAVASPFTIKTEYAKNILVVKLNEAIKELKLELINQTPRFDDMDLYIEALKEDILSINDVKNHYKMKK